MGFKSHLVNKLKASLTKHKFALIFLLASCVVSTTSAQNMFYHLLGINAYPDFTWTGLGGDSNWSNNLNWNGNIVPGASNTAHFIGPACTTHCNATVNSNVSVAGVDIQSTYTGTITQASAATVTIGSSGWTQTAGTFIGSDANVTFNGDFNVTGGTYTATSATTLNMASLNWIGGTFNHNSGSLVIKTWAGSTRTLNFGTVIVNNLKFTSGPSFDNNTWNIAGNITVNGLYNLEDAGSITKSFISGGTFYLKGDVTSSGNYITVYRNRSTYKIAGSTNQTITGSATSGLSNLEIISTGGTVTFSSAFANVGNFKYTSGTVVMPTDFIQTVEWTYTGLIDPGALVFNNYQVNRGCDFDLATYTIVSTVKINGNLNFNSIAGCGGQPTISGSNFEVKGDITSTINMLGTSGVRALGSGNQTISGTGYIPKLEIASTGGTVTISGTPIIRYSFTYTSGSVVATGSTVSFNAPFGQAFPLTPGPIVFDNVTFLSATGNDGIIFNLGGATLIVNGNLWLSQPSGGTKSSINNGTITVGKNLTEDGGGGVGFLGTAAIQLVGTNAATVNIVYTIPGGTLTSSKSATTATLTRAANLSFAGQDMTIDNGTFNLAGFNLGVNDVFTLGPNGKLLCNGGTVTAATYVIQGQVLCPLSLGIAWTGLAGDHLWTTAGNWTNNTIPGASDIALFDSACTGANCNATINGNISVKGIILNSTYTGTVTQGAGNTFTVGTSGWIQQAGSFVGGNSAITQNGPFVLSGGSFTATSGTMTVNANYTVSGIPTFTHNSGTVAFLGSGTLTVTPSTVDYYNVTFAGFTASYDLIGTMNILGTLSAGKTSVTTYTINLGTLLAKGDVALINNGYMGTALLKIAGSTNQTVTGVANAKMMSIEIASTGGTVTFAGTITCAANFTYTSGVVNAGTSTLQFVGDAAVVIKPGTVTYNNVTIAGYLAVIDLSAATMTVGGTLTMGKTSFTSYSVNNGTLLALGDVVFNNNGYFGTVQIKVAGSTNQTISGISTAAVPSLEIASTGGIVTLSGMIELWNNYTYTSGVVDAGTSTLVFYGDTTTHQIKPGPVAYYNVSILGYTALFDFNGQTMTINGDLQMGRSAGGASFTVNNGTLLLKGNASFINNGYYGTILIKVAGSTNQTITGISSSAIPSFEIASTGGIVTLSGTLVFISNYVYTSGTLATGTSSVNFNGGGNLNLTAGPFPYYDVSFNAGNASYAITDTLTVNNTLTIGKGSGSAYYLDTGTIIANKDVVFNQNGYYGSATLTMAGSTAGTLNIGSTAASLSTTIVVNKSGGASVALAGNSSVSTAGQDFTISAGILDLNGYDFNVVDVLTVASGATLKCNGGEFTSGSLVNNGTVNCPGFSTYSFNWTGAAADGNFSTATNWSGGVTPAATDIAVFQDTYCGANCNATINTSSSVKGVQLLSPYTGTLTQAAGQTLTVGTRGWKQLAGTFVGGNSVMTINSKFTLTAGSFTSTSNVLNLNIPVIAINPAATFNHNNGTVTLNENSNWNTIAHNFGSKTLYNLNVIGNGTIANASTITVLNNFLIDHSGYASKFKGQVDLYGNMTVNNQEDGTYLAVRFLGSANQTVTTTGVAGAGSTNVGHPIFQKTGGTVTFTGDQIFSGVEYISGTVSLPVAGTTKIIHNSNPDCWAVDTVIPGPIQFANVNYGNCGPTSITGTLSVNGNLYIDTVNAAAAVRNGKFQVTGNYTLNRDENVGSSTDIEMIGSSNATIISNGQINPGNLTISKTAGAVVNMGSAVTVRNGNSGVRLASGTLNQLGYTMTIGDAVGTNNKLTLEAGTVVNQGGGTLTYEALVNNGGVINP